MVQVYQFDTRLVATLMMDRKEAIWDWVITRELTDSANPTQVWPVVKQSFEH